MSLIPSSAEIIKLLKAGLTIEAQEKIMELRVAALDVEAENLNLKTRIAELESELHQRKSLKHDRSLYWLESDPVPLCPRCWENTQKLIHLYHPGQRFVTANSESWQCHSCHHDFWAEKGDPFIPHLDTARSTRGFQ